MVIIDITIPAVAMPFPPFFLPTIPRISPTIPKHEPIKKVYVEMVRKVVESEERENENAE